MRPFLQGLSAIFLDKCNFGNSLPEDKLIEGQARVDNPVKHEGMLPGPWFVFLLVEFHFHENLISKI